MFPLGGLSLFRLQPLRAHELPEAHWFPELVWGCRHHEASGMEGMEWRVGTTWCFHVQLWGEEEFHLIKA